MNNRNQAKTASILAKTAAYCEFYKAHRSIDDYPAGVLEGATEAAQSGQISYLKAISKELDVRIREVFSPQEQDLVLLLMLKKKVEPTDLPRTFSLQKVRNLIKKGAIKSVADHLLAKQFIEPDKVSMLLDEEAQALGSMLDKHEAKEGLHDTRRSVS